MSQCALWARLHRAVLCTAISAAGCAAVKPPPSQQSPLVGKPMPAFEARTLSGNELYSGAYEGRNLVVSFVDAQCKPCDDSLIAAQRMYAENHEVVVVAVVSHDKAEGAANLSRSLGLKFPVIVDANGSIAKRFEVRAVPRTFVMSKSGRVAWVGGPDMTTASLTAAVRAD